MADMLETKTLVKALEQMPPVPTLFRDLFFPGELTHNTRKVEIDITKSGRKVAPYVSPVIEGQVMKRDAVRTDTIKLPYLKPKYDVTAVEALKRQPGETPYSEKSHLDRARVVLNKRLSEGQQAINRTIEVQAAQAVVLGKVTAKGKDEADADWTIEIDFGRNTDHNVVKAAGGYWTVATVNPIEDLEAWSQLIMDNGLHSPVHVVFGLNAWRAFRDNPIVQKLYDNRRFELGKLELTQKYKDQGVQHVGGYGQWQFWLYTEKYEDPATGALTELLPSNTVILGCEGTRNAVNYGAIVDLEASNSPIERKVFPKSWLQKDPSVQWLLLQSSPLATLHEPDSTVAAVVVA